MAGTSVRILYLADIRFPLERANGIQTMETVTALAERGHDVTLVVRPDTVQPPRDPFVFYDRTPDPRLRVAAVPVTGPEPGRRALFLAAAVAYVLEGGRDADVVLTRDLGVAGAALRVPSALRPPVVYESHGYAPVFADTMPELVAGARRAGRLKQRRLSRREARVWRRADGYVTTTRVLAAELTERFGRRARVFPVPNGVRLPAGGACPDYHPGDPPVVAYAGHLYPWKGCDVMVRALTLLPGVHGLVIGGRGGRGGQTGRGAADADFARLRALVTELGLDERVTITGLVPRAEVAERLARADVLALPTVDTPSARYTSPLKMFEYMAAGRPIVASDLSPIAEVLTDGRNARLVRPGDPSALADAVRALVAEPAEAARLARAAFADVAAYSWARRAERLETLLGAVVCEA